MSDRLLLPRYAVSGDPWFGTVEVTIEELAEYRDVKPANILLSETVSP
ncbi:hypothetical protein [Rhodococcus sp. JS3073]|nr:hypothetical protein [Rhodococcus sp. JS3073]WAM19467.1 hypothetical protein OYT95_44235 [Rhodococcus sp. JS3073]